MHNCFKCTAAHDGVNLFPVSGRTSAARMQNQMEPVQCSAEPAAQSELTTTKFRRALFICLLRPPHLEVGLFGSFEQKTVSCDLSCHRGF